MQHVPADSSRGGGRPRTDAPIAVQNPVRERPSTEQPLGREPVLDVPISVLERYNARVLDPTAALVLPGQNLRSTVYLADRLLVNGVADFAARDTLTKVAEELGYSLEPPLVDPTVTELRRALFRAAQVPDEHPFNSVAVKLVPNATQPRPPADAWTVLQTYRSRIEREDIAQQHVALDHLITSGGHTHGWPFVPRASDNAFGGLPMSAYGLPGWGGRQPVAWVGGAPHRRSDVEFPGPRRPVVAILDTGVGDHDWFRNKSIVTVNPEVNNIRIGLQDPNTDPEVKGVIDDPLEGPLDSDAGHGTFIAGLIHQQCPDANILSIRVMASDGAVPEHVLLDALVLLALRQQQAQQANDAGEIVDVVSLSLGYYHELVDDPSFDPLILGPLNALAESGAVIVAAAGNDATMRPLFPAAFAPAKDGVVTTDDPKRVPIVAVGALNPDQTIALFSNAGPWVTIYRTGASVVSTFPQTFNASAQPTYRLHAFDGWRETIDPDDFRGGFGVWSGTSFSAPIFAGELAQELLKGAYGDFASVGQADMVTRARDAVATHLLRADEEAKAREKAQS